MGYRHPRNVPAADYTLRYNDAESGRGVYSFCMCPGGEVINSASEAGGIVVNGMSQAAREDVYSNSALVVSVRPGDWSEAGVLGGVAFQVLMEQAAFRAGGGGYLAPAQNLMAFLGQKGDNCRSSCRPGVKPADLATVLPDFVVSRPASGFATFQSADAGFCDRGGDSGRGGNPNLRPVADCARRSWRIGFPPADSIRSGRAPVMPAAS